MLDHFEQWDADADGTLSVPEVAALVVDSQYTGDEAAAVAALQIALRSRKIQVPPLTREYFAQHVALAIPVATTEPADDDDGMAAPTTATTQPLAPPQWERYFAGSVRRIRAADRQLFVHEVPSLERCRQGPLGDCYFVSVVGALLARDPQELPRMIQADGETAYTVRFADLPPVRVTSLTDAQIAIGSSSGRDGLWLTVLERAFAARRNDLLPEDAQHDEPTDIIAHGGTSGSTIRLLTGHVSRRIVLGGSSTTRPTTAPTAARLAKVREALRDGVAQRRVMAAGTPPTSMPPGVSPNHAYAVLDYDEQQDEVALWNPHCNRYEPKGPPGREFGYVTKGGRFRMPLSDFVAVFRGMVVETDKAAPPASAPSTRPRPPTTRPATP